MTNNKRQTFQKVHAEYEAWENSLDGVAYWLGDLPGLEPVEEVIIKTVHKLPSQIREFVYGKCHFISPDSDHEKTCSLRTAKRPWLLILDQDQPDEEAVAHQIACAWLRHRNKAGSQRYRETQGSEEAACDLVKEWGFNGFGTETAWQKQ